METSHAEAVVFIPLSRRMVTVIDFDDFVKVRDFKWCASHGKDKKRRPVYAVRRRKTKEKGESYFVYMHRVIMDCPDGLQVDHINGDGLDNRRCNLRVVTNTENNRAYKRKRLETSSIFRGVNWDGQTGKWRAKISAGGRTFHVGRFEDETEAAAAYDSKSRELGFPKECQNFPE